MILKNQILIFNFVVADIENLYRLAMCVFIIKILSLQGFRVLVDAPLNQQYLPLKTDQNPREWEFRL